MSDASKETTDTPHREFRFDVLRNSADLYGAVYRIICILAAYDLSQGEMGLGYFRSRDLGRIATKVLPHLPKPAEDANVW